MITGTRIGNELLNSDLVIGEEKHKIVFFDKKTRKEIKVDKMYIKEIIKCLLDTLEG